MPLDWCCPVHGVIKRLYPLHDSSDQRVRICPVSVGVVRICDERTFFAPSAIDLALRAHDSRWGMERLSQFEYRCPVHGRITDVDMDRPLDRERLCPVPCDEARCSQQLFLSEIESMERS